MLRSAYDGPLRETIDALERWDSLAGVDLVYVGLNVVLTSVETALRNLDGRSPASPGA